MEFLTQPVDKFYICYICPHSFDSTTNKEIPILTGNSSLDIFIINHVILRKILSPSPPKKFHCLSHTHFTLMWYSFLLHEFKEIWPIYLMIHNNFISHGIQQGCLCNKIFLTVLILFLPSLLYIIACQCIQASHLVFLRVSIVQTAVYTCCFRRLYKLFRFSLLEVKNQIRIIKSIGPCK